MVIVVSSWFTNADFEVGFDTVSGVPLEQSAVRRPRRDQPGASAARPPTGPDFAGAKPAGPTPLLPLLFE
jgi:hypothetical protein